MQIGIVTEETWSFLHEIYADLSQHHQTNLFSWTPLTLPIFNTRLNRYKYHSSLQKFMKEQDVVFFEWASHLLETATHMPKQCGIVTRLHRYEMYQWVDKINWAAVDKVIVVSQAKKQEFLARFPTLSDKVVVITEAVDPDKFCLKPKTFQGNIGILCHLTPRKRVYELILAFYELQQQRHNFHLHIGGGADPIYGDYYFALNDLVKNLALEDKVTFYGNVSEPQDWYQMIDIYISNGFSEGLQVAPMEAMASGCYTLVHRWAGADELLPEPYLYFTDSQLIEKILAYSDLPEAAKQAERQQMRNTICENFNIHRNKQEVRHLLESVGGQPLFTRPYSSKVDSLQAG